MAEYSFDDLFGGAASSTSAAQPKATRGSTSWSDYGYDVAGSAVTSAADALRAMEEYVPSVTGTRRRIEQAGKSLSEGVSPEFKRRRELSITGAVEGDTIYGEGVSAIPGNVAPVISSAAGSSAIPLALGAVGGLAGPGGAVAGFAAGSAAAGAMTMGSITREIQQVIESIPADKRGGRYAQLRADNRSDLEAVEQLAREVSGNFALAGGAITAGSAVLGPAGTLMRALRAQGTNAAKTGFRKEVLRSILGEGGEEAATEALKQGALKEGYGLDYDPGQILEAGAKGAVGGAGTTAGVRAGTAVLPGGRAQVSDDRGNLVGDAEQRALDTGLNRGNQRNVTGETRTDGDIISNVQAKVQEAAAQQAQAQQAAQQAIQTEPAPAAEQWLRSKGPSNLFGPDVEGQAQPAPAAQAPAAPAGTSQPAAEPVAQPEVQPQRRADAEERRADAINNLLFQHAEANGGRIYPRELGADLAQRGLLEGADLQNPEAAAIRNLIPLVNEGVLRQGLPSRGSVMTFNFPTGDQATQQPAAAPQPAPTLDQRRAPPPAPASMQPQQLPDYPTPGAGRARFARGVALPQEALDRRVAANEQLAAAAAARREGETVSQRLRRRAATARPVREAAPAQAPLQGRQRPIRTAEPTRAPSGQGRAPIRRGRPAVTPTATPVAAPTAEQRVETARAASEALNAATQDMRDAWVRAQAAMDAASDGQPESRTAAEAAWAEAEAATVRAKRAAENMTEATRAPGAPSAEINLPPLRMPRAAQPAPETPKPPAPKTKAKGKRVRGRKAEAGKTPPARPTQAAPAAKAARETKPSASTKPEAPTPPTPAARPEPTPAPEPEAAKPEAPKPAVLQKRPSTQQINAAVRGLEGLDSDALWDAAVEAAPKERDGRPNIGVINGTIRMVQAPNAAPANVTNWDTALSMQEKAKVAAILRAWRNKYGSKIDATKRRPLVTWLTTQDSVQEPARDLASNEQIAALAAKFRGEVTAEAQPEVELSDRGLLDALDTEFAKLRQKGDDVRSLAVSALPDARAKAAADGVTSLDYPALLNAARARVAQLDADQRSAAVATFKSVRDALADGANLDEALQIARGIEAGPPAQPLPPAEARRQADRVATQRDDILRRVLIEEMTPGLKGQITRLNKLLPADQAITPTLIQSLKDRATQHVDYVAQRAGLSLTRAEAEGRAAARNVRSRPVTEWRINAETPVRDIRKIVNEGGEAAAGLRLAFESASAKNPQENPANPVLRATWLDPFYQAAVRKWNEDSAARRTAAKDEFLSVLPAKLLVEPEFSPKADESLQDAFARLEAAYKEMQARIGALRDENPRQFRVATEHVRNRHMPAPRLMRSIERLTNGGTQPLTAIDPTRAAHFEFVPPKNLAEFTRWYNGLSDRSSTAADTKVAAKIQTYLGREIARRENIRSTERWSDLYDDMASRSETANLNESAFRKAVDKEYEKQYGKVKPIAYGVKALEAVRTAVVARNNRLNSLVAYDFYVRNPDLAFETDTTQVTSQKFVLVDKDSGKYNLPEGAEIALAPGATPSQLDILLRGIKPLKMENPNPFATTATKQSQINSDPSPLPTGTYSWQQAMNTVFGGRPLDPARYGELASLNQRLATVLQFRNPTVVVGTQTDIVNAGGTVNDVGLYDPRTNIAYVLEGRSATEMQITVQHELYHAATIFGLRIEPMKSQMEALFADAKQRLTSKVQEQLGYRISTVDEFLTYGNMDPEAQAIYGSTYVSPEVARQLGYGPQRVSFMRAMLDRILSFFGYPQEQRYVTLLEALTNLGAQTMAAQATYFQTLEAVRADNTLLNMVSPTAMREMQTKAGEMSVNAKGAGFEKLLYMMTVTDIAARYGNLFSWSGNGVRKYLQRDFETNPLSQLERAQAAERQERNTIEERLRLKVDMVANHRAANPEEAEQVGRLLVKHTTWDVDPTVSTPPKDAKEDGTPSQQLAYRRYNEVRSDYVALTDAGKTAFKLAVEIPQLNSLAIVKQSVVSGILQKWQWEQLDLRRPGDALRPGVPAEMNEEIAGQIAERYLNDQATPEDAAWLGDGFTALASDFRAASNGLTNYFPLMRAGKFGIIGRRTDFEKVNVARNEADALAIAERIDASGGYVSGIQQRVVDANGNPVPEADREGRNDLRKQWVVLANNEIYETRDTEAEAIARVAELRKEDNVEVRDPVIRQAGQAQGLDPLTSQQYNKLKRAVTAMTADEGRQNQMLEAFGDVVVSLLPGANIRHSTITRRNVIGASQDHIRALNQYVDSSSKYLSSLKHRVFRDAALQAMEDYTRAAQDGKGIRRDAIINVLKVQRANDTVLGANTNGFWSVVARYTAFNYLFSVRYAVLQLLQPAIMGPGVMARLFPKVSLGDITSEMTQAHVDVGGLRRVLSGGSRQLLRAARKAKNAPVGEPVQMIERIKKDLIDQRVPDARALGELYDLLADWGRVSEFASIEVARGAQQQPGRIKRGALFAEDVSRAFPTSAEIYNRLLMGTAAFRLARKQGLSDTEAVNAADTAIRDSQFVYNAENQAVLFQYLNRGIGAPLLVFKKFVQGVYSKLIMATYDSVRGASPAVRTAARRQLMLTLATHQLVAGSMGLPTEPFRIVAGIAAFFFGDDEPWDTDAEIVKMYNNFFGDKAIAEVAASGLPRLFGIDLSGSVGLASLAFGRGLDDFTETSWAKKFAAFVGGAPGGIITDVFRARARATESGDWTEYSGALPKIFKDAIAGYKMSEQGLTDTRGKRIDEGLVTAGDGFLQALGFTPSTVANIRAERSRQYQENKAEQRDRGRIHRDIITAREKNDAEKLADAEERRAKFNSTNPMRPITEESIARSQATRDRARDPEKTYLGVPGVGGKFREPIYNVPSPATRQPQQPAQPAAPAQRQSSAPPPANPVFDSIIAAEGTNAGGRDPYNVVLGYGQFGTPPKQLTQMTLGEVYDWGQNVLRRNHRAAGTPGDPSGRGSSAVGAFQIVGATMVRHMAEAGLTLNDKFTPENQRRLAAVILRREGLTAWDGFRYNPTLLATAKRALREA